MNFSKNQYRWVIFMFITINMLFYFKYFSRISLWAACAGVGGYLLMAWILWGKAPLRLPLACSNKVLFLVMGAFLVFCAGALYYIPKELLNVDRWEVIQVFWDAAADGTNPYGVRNSVGNYPGPMPVYFLLYYPFYVLGEVGYATLLLVVFWLCSFYKRFPRAIAGMMCVALFSSAFLYWEIFTRSTILLNACLFCYFFLYLLKMERPGRMAFYGSAVAGGLLFSIRTVFVLCMLVWVVYALRTRKITWLQLIRWGSVFVVTFGLTFLPFLLRWPDEFRQMNPFVIQSSVLIPFGYVCVFLGIAFLLGFLAKNESDVFFYSAAVLFAMITTHFGYWIGREEFTEAYFNGRSDISYYLFSVPFLLEIMARRRAGLKIRV